MSYDVRLIFLVLCLFLTACNSSSSSSADAPVAPEVAVEEREGVSTDYLLVSNLDGEDIAFTVHEPLLMREPGSFPLVLHSHGYGGSRIAAADREGVADDPVFSLLLAEGYGVISIDQRGFGESGGKVRILDPYFEGQDLLQVLDWAETHLDWLMYRDGNLVLGAYGGSYGGGYQHLIYAIDPLRRLDAIVPEITWHDLRYSLYPNGVFKSYWAALLSIVGNLKAPSGGQDTIVNQGLIQGTITNTLSEEQLALLYQNSLASHCEGNNNYVEERLGGAGLTSIDAMYWQGTADTLFNLNEQINNVRCLSALGGDVRLITKNQGHDSAGNGGEQCGGVRKAQATLHWFDDKLKGERGKADYIPRVCYQLDGSEADAVVLPALPETTLTVPFDAQELISVEGSAQSISVPLTQVGVDGAVLAGIPKLTVSLLDPTGANAGDPIIFATLMRRPVGSDEDVALNPNMVLPLRGFTEDFETELFGVANRLQPGDELRLVLYAAYPSRYPNAGNKVAVPVSVSGKVSLPLYSADLPAPPIN